jgi:hypothetical protein
VGYEISKSYMRRSEQYDPFHIIKATVVNGSVKYYEGYSEMYDRLISAKKADQQCSSLNGDVIVKSPIYRTIKANKNVVLTQFVRGLNLETTFTPEINNDLMRYTGFSPESFDDFMSVLSTGKNYLRVSSADLFATSNNGDQLIGIKYADEYRAIKDDDDDRTEYRRIHRFMSKDGICYYLLMNVDCVYVPFLVRDFDPME